jgi:hypothetical protein
MLRHNKERGRRRERVQETEAEAEAEAETAAEGSQWRRLSWRRRKQPRERDDTSISSCSSVLDNNDRLSKAGGFWGVMLGDIQNLAGQLTSRTDVTDRGIGRGSRDT